MGFRWINRTLALDISEDVTEETEAKGAFKVYEYDDDKKFSETSTIIGTACSYSDKKTHHLLLHDSHDNLAPKDLEKK